MCVGCHFSWHVRAAQMQFGNLVSHHFALFYIVRFFIFMLFVIILHHQRLLSCSRLFTEWLSPCGHSCLDLFLLLWQLLFSLAQLPQLPWHFLSLCFMWPLPQGSLYLHSCLQIGYWCGLLFSFLLRILFQNSSTIFTFRCVSVRPQAWHPTLSPLYDL